MDHERHGDRERRPDDERDQATPKRASRVERAEGSRETPSQGEESGVPPAAFGERGSEQAGGISNRPVHEEQERQESLPPRGERRDDHRDKDKEVERW
jgi:hypothetical protein